MVEVGWAIDSDKATFIWDGPSRVSRDQPRARHAKSVTFCPAVLDHEARLFQVPCPIDLQLRCRIDEKTKQPVLTNPAGDQSSIRPKALSQFMVMVNAKEWRHADKPIIQMFTPYIFVADERVYITQLPPICHFQPTPWPGLVVGGRMPIDVWPRHLMWAFEWHDLSKDLILRRGEPWFYLRFETDDAARPVRLIEADMTPELKEYVRGLSGVTNYVNRTFSLFDTARARRPRSLLVAKKR